MPLDPVREQAAWEISRMRQIHARALPNGRWQAFSAGGLAIVPGDHSDPVEALEAAETALAAGELQAATTKAKRLFDALARGTYIPAPTQPNGNGQFSWRVVRTVDQVVVAGPGLGLMAALLEIATLVGEPVE
jgi:hypothetical protein